MESKWKIEQITHFFQRFRVSVSASVSDVRNNKKMLYPSPRYIHECHLRFSLSLSLSARVLNIL